MAAPAISQIKGEVVALWRTTPGELLRSAAKAAPDRLALIVPAFGSTPLRTWTYRQLLEQAEQAASALLNRFEPGAHVATWAASRPELVILQFAASLAGLVLVTLNPANQAFELEYLLRQSRARGLFLDRAYRGRDNPAILAALTPKLPELKEVSYLEDWSRFVDGVPRKTLPAVAAEAPAMILFTSGTTGKPKGVVLTQGSVVNTARLGADRIGLRQGSVWLNVLPLFHVGGSVAMTLGCLSNIGTQVLIPEFNPEWVLKAAQQHRPTILMAVPTMLHALFAHPEFATTDFSPMEVVITGATAIAPELVREMKRRFGADVMVMFGQTETAGCACLTRRGDSEDQITLSVGAIMPASEAKIVAPEGGAVQPIGEVGEICVKTRCAMIGYFEMPEQTAQTIDRDGFVHTGDLGYMRPDGYLQITGRLKDMIIRGGENIYPREVEDRLVEHPAVAQAAVFGVTDPTWGEQVAAAVILKPGQKADEAMLTAYLEERIARHKVPKHWKFVQSFPINASGKVQKFILRESFEAAR